MYRRDALHDNDGYLVKWLADFMSRSGMRRDRG
jgi:hypothetical protein